MKPEIINELKEQGAFLALLLSLFGIFLLIAFVLDYFK